MTHFTAGIPAGLGAEDGVIPTTEGSANTNWKRGVRKMTRDVVLWTLFERYASTCACVHDNASHHYLRAVELHEVFVQAVELKPTQ